MKIETNKKDLIKLKTIIWNIPKWTKLKKLTWSKIHKHIYSKESIYGKEDVYQDTFFMYLEIVLKYNPYKMPNYKKRSNETSKERDIRLFKQYYAKQLTYKLQNLSNRKLRIENQKKVDIYYKIISKEAKTYNL